jgi:serine/threonine-protein kinase
MQGGGAAAGAIPAPAPAALPARLGRYELREEIGRGGMGSVLRGHDPDLGRDLAVKVLLPHQQNDPAVVRRFTKEAQIGGQLQHPGIVPVYEMGHSADQRPYFTMKLIQGRTLAALLNERSDPRQDQSRFEQIFEQVCQTMAYAHSRGVIHRDLKPSNIMVGAFGEVQVMDWGLAKVLAPHQPSPFPHPPGPSPTEEREGEKQREEAHNPDLLAPPSPALGEGGWGGEGNAAECEGRHTQAGRLLGTPAYMAPEQATGEVSFIDQRCDVFGLGAILCEILTGQPPYYHADDMLVLSKAMRGDLTEALAQLGTCGADAELIRLATSSLAARPSARPRDAGALAAEMAAYRESKEARLRAAELAQAQAHARAEEEHRRRRLTLGLVASVLFTVLVTAGCLLWMAHQRALAGQQEHEIRAALIEEAEEALAQAISLRAQARGEGFGPKCAEARAQATRAQTLLERLPEQPGLSERVHRLMRELEAEEADRRLLGWVEEIRMLKAEVGPRDTKLTPGWVLPEYEAALSAYGVVVGTPPEQAGRRIRQRPTAFRQRVVTALDDWLVLVPRSDAAKEKWLTAMLAEADPDPWRQELRVARRARNREKLERLAAGSGVASQPAQALRALGEALRDRDAPQQALALLRRAQQRYPDDFWLNYELAQQVSRQNNNPTDAVRFFTVCVALRPRSPLAELALGAALERAGDLNRARAAYRRALTLKMATMLAPQDNLSQTWRERADPASNLAALRRGPVFLPGRSRLLNRIGVALLRQGDLDNALKAFFHAARAYLKTLLSHPPLPAR